MALRLNVAICNVCFPISEGIWKIFETELEWNGVWIRQGEVGEGVWNGLTVWW